MSTATVKVGFATIGTYTVAAGQTATLGMGAILSGADDAVATGGANSDLVIGIFRATAAAAARVDVTHFGPIERVLVGTGGATRGAKAQIVADGFADAPAHAAGATVRSIYGIFMQSGVAGDRVGMMLCVGNRESA